MSKSDEQAQAAGTAAAPAVDTKEGDTTQGQGQPQPQAGDALVEVDEDSQGNTYLPGVKPLVNERLKALGDATKHLRDAMASARTAYVEKRDELIDEMQKQGVPVYELDTGETVELTDKLNVKIKKRKSNLAGVTKDELPGSDDDELDVD